MFYRFIKTYTEEKSLPSYICKTVMLWVCELQSQSWWEDTLFEDCVLHLTKFMHKCIKEKCLKHYFIEEVNLMEYYPSTVLSLVESALTSLEKDVYRILKCLLSDMSKEIDIAHTHLIVKSLHCLNCSNSLNCSKCLHPFDLSVKFVYEQNCLSKLNLILENFIKLFWYYYFHKTYIIYTAVSSTKAEIIIQAQIIDLLTKLLQFRENEELKKIHLVQKKKLGNLLLQITNLDKTIPTYFSGLKSLTLLSCSQCDVCGMAIKCKRKRYSCYNCMDAGCFDVCLKCINTKNISQWIQVHAEHLDNSGSGKLPFQNENHQHSVGITCFNTHVALKNRELSEVKTIPCLFPDLFSHLVRIVLFVPEFDINKFNHFSCSYENKLGLAFRELKQLYDERNDEINKLKAFSSVEEVKPVPVIENICQKFFENLQVDTSHKVLPVINKCGLGIHPLYLKECYSSYCYTKFHDPPGDFSYWKFALVLEKNCWKIFYKIASSCIPLKHFTNFGCDLPGEIIKNTGLLKKLISFGEDSCVRDGANIAEMDFTNQLENSSKDLTDIAELFTNSIEKLRKVEKSILKISHLIQVFQHLVPGVQT